MKATIESTALIVHANGVPCRVWEGVTEGGVKIELLIVRVAVREGQDLSQFETELQEQKAPSADVAAFPSRMIL